jgi:hypothetical protein
MTDENDFQTAQAAKSAHLKTTFDAAVKDMFKDYTVDLTAPEESTGGGIRARQHIRLVANDGRSLVVGSANAADGTAELRTLGCTLEVSKQRFGVELPIPGPEYIKFLERATDCLGIFGMKVSVISTVSAARAKSDE